MNFLFLEHVKASHFIFLLLFLSTLLFDLPLEVLLIFVLLSLLDLVLIDRCCLGRLAASASPSRYNVSKLVPHGGPGASSSKLAEKVPLALTGFVHLMNIVPTIR